MPPPASYEKKFAFPKIEAVDHARSHLSGHETKKEKMKRKKRKKRREKKDLRGGCERDPLPLSQRQHHRPPSLPQDTRGARICEAPCPLLRFRQPHSAARVVASAAPARSSSRPHTLVAQGLIHWELKASYTSSIRPHTVGAQGLTH